MKRAEAGRRVDDPLTVPLELHGRVCLILRLSCNFALHTCKVGLESLDASSAQDPPLSETLYLMIDVHMSLGVVPEVAT